MTNRSPFLDAPSFEMGDVPQETLETSASLRVTPFMELYGSELAGELFNPESEEYVEFLSELYDEEFDVALATLVDEATAIYETHFLHEAEDPQAIGYQAERLLNQHFAPLVQEAEAMVGALAREFGQRDPNALSEDEIETIVDRYQPSIELSPSFEEFFGKLKKAFKKVTSKAVSLAKKGISLAARLGLGPVLEKLKGVIKPMLKRVIETAIGKLPAHLQPIARKLAEKLPFLKEFEQSDESMAETARTYGVAEIQYEFDQGVANLLFAPTEVEQDLEIARVLTEQSTFETYPLNELDRARDQFVEGLLSLKEGEDPTPLVENFLPAILPALRIGIRIIGRKKVVDFLAKLLGKLIVKFVGPQYTPALSQAIVDAGLRLLQLEATSEDESRAAASAVAATVEETVRQVASLPEYILDDQELLEGFALEAFEQAAAASLPAVLPEDVYRKRPELGEGRKLRGVWVMMPGGRRKRYKKFSRRIKTQLAPHKVSALETFEGTPVDEFLEEQLGIAPGEEVEAFVHLFEAMPGTHLSDIARQEEVIPRVDISNEHAQIHPLTREAAGLLLNEPEMGRDFEQEGAMDPLSPTAGQRFYYLEVPGKRPLTAPEPGGKAKPRGPTRLRLILDFPKNEARLYLFLSEIRAQELAVKLRQNAHLGGVTARLRKILVRRLRSVFKGAFGRLKIIHEAVTPDQWMGALRRMPPIVQQMLLKKLTEWVMKGLSEHLKQNKEEFIKAAEDTADGVMVAITLENPPGFPQIRQALKGKGLSPGSLKVEDGSPVVKIKFTPGYTHE